MAAIVTKVGATGFGRPQKERIARVGAKKAARMPKKATAAKADDAEPELDAEALAGDVDEGEVVEDVSEASVEKKSKARPDGGTYLSMYFKDMAALDVLRPEEEFTAAREIEALEIMLWEAVLSHAPAVEHVIAAIELLLPLPTEAKNLRTASEKTNCKDWNKLVARAARKLRAADTDHLFIDAALLTIDRVALGIGVRGADVGSLGRERARAEWLRKVVNANRAATDARNDFVRANLRLVVSIARRFNHGRMALADLIQEGNLGLLKAVERYDYRRGFRFSTYAAWWIRHAISRAISDKGRTVRLPVHLTEVASKLARTGREFEQTRGRAATDEELSALTGISLERIRRVRRAYVEAPISLEQPLPELHGLPLVDAIADPDAATPGEHLDDALLRESLEQVIETLSPIELEILRLRLGSDEGEGLTLQEIGQRYALSRERIRQLQERALTKLRGEFRRRSLLVA